MHLGKTWMAGMKPAMTAPSRARLRRAWPTLQTHSRENGTQGALQRLSFVMPALVAGIHVLG